MKVWTGFGSEHSYSLVLIGHFADERDARAVEEAFPQLQQLASQQADSLSWDEDAGRFPKELYNALEELKIWNLNRSDIDGFNYLEHLKREGATVVVHTDDAEIQGVLKLLLDHGARIEIYSLQRWTEEGEPRKPEPTDEETDEDKPAEGDATSSKSEEDAGAEAE